MKDVPSIPAVKVKMMEASLRCLIFGLLGLLPVIGLPFALIAGWNSDQALALEKHHWNPARSLRVLGLSYSAVGILNTVGCLAIWGIYYRVFGR